MLICFAIKLDAIKLIIPDNVDIMIFSETKLDASYPTAQLLINGFSKPFRLDRNSAGGGLLIYIRTDIPCKQLNNYNLPDTIEGIFIEINLRKSKWLLLGTYHPPSQNDNFYFNNIALALDIHKSMIKFCWLVILMLRKRRLFSTTLWNYMT